MTVKFLINKVKLFLYSKTFFIVYLDRAKQLVVFFTVYFIYIITAYSVLTEAVACYTNIVKTK